VEISLTLTRRGNNALPGRSGILTHTDSVEFSVSSSLQYNKGGGKGVAVTVGGLGGVEGMGVGKSRFTSPGRSTLSSWFRRPDSQSKKSTLSSPGSARGDAGVESAASPHVLGGGESGGGGGVSSHGRWGNGPGDRAKSCRQIVRQHAITSRDGTHKVSLNMSIVAPGILVMGAPGAEEGASGGGAEGARRRDWVGDVARAVREVAGSGFVVVNTNVGSGGGADYDAAWFSRKVLLARDYPCRRR